MDLALYLRVLWRFRVLVVTGLLVATGLSLLSVVTVGFEDGKPSFSYREREEWASYATLWVTQTGFESGEIPVAGDGTAQGSAERIAAQQARDSRLIGLAILYARLVQTDPVRSHVYESGRVPGRIEAAPLPAIDGRDEVLPLISIAGISDTGERSLFLTRRAVDGLKEYIAREQILNGTPTEERVLLKTVNQPGSTIMLKGRPRTLPFVVFFTVLAAVVGLVLILENLRPRIRPVAGSAAPAVPAPDEVRRSVS